MTTSSDVANFDRFLGAITQRFGDPTFSILKAHLLFEEVLRSYLGRALPNADALSGARLTFAQILALVRALQQPEEDDWQWEALEKLNRLRNQLAHHVEPKERDAKIAELVTFMTTHSRLPLPAPSRASGDADTHGASAQAVYQAIDMVNGALFASLARRLGFTSFSGDCAD